MKIQSNYKDYYDFLGGKYGQDPKAVYNRVCMTQHKLSGPWEKTGLYKPEWTYGAGEYRFHILAICGVIYCVYWYKGKIYHGPECEAIPENRCINRSSSINEGRYSYNSVRHLTTTNINFKEKCPVMIVRKAEWPEHGDWTPLVKNPKLRDFSMGSVIPPDKMWVDLTNFLLAEPQVESKQTDRDKVQAHGFDVVKSFRRMER